MLVRQGCHALGPTNPSAVAECISICGEGVLKVGSVLCPTGDLKKKLFGVYTSTSNAKASICFCKCSKSLQVVGLGVVAYRKRYLGIPPRLEEPQKVLGRT